MVKRAKSKSIIGFTGSLHLSLRLKVLKQGNEAYGGTQRPCLSTTFYALKRGESKAEEFKSRRPRLCQMLLTLKREGHDRPKPISKHK